MNYNIKSIPTNYNGVKFRSRLEAKWAVFFDLIGWHWEYEPSQINNYNPDFILKCSSSAYPNVENIIVEIKPSVFLTPEKSNELYDKYSQFNCHFLLLDDTPFYYDQFHEIIKLGIGSQRIESENIGLIEINMKCVNDFGSYEISYDGMIYGKVDRKSFVYNNDKDHLIIKKLWREAGNLIQFNYD